MTRLADIARRVSAERDAAQERCDLCGEPIPAEHRHIVDVQSRELQCACRACALLFDKGGAGGGHFRLVPDRRLRLDGFVLDDAAWASLRIPVEMAFFFHSSAAGRVMAFYPGPMGATESLLELETWDSLAAANSVLERMQPDTEALLVNRARGAREYWLAPIDDCYELVGLIRTRWRGLSGGTEVWKEIDGFFGALRRKAEPAGRRATEEVA